MDLDQNYDDPLMTDIKVIVRGAIDAGLIAGVTLAEFDETMAELDTDEQEGYLQSLWDEI